MKTTPTPAQECKVHVNLLTLDFKNEIEKAADFTKQQKRNLKVFKFLVECGINPDTAHRLSFCKSNSGLIDIWEEKLLGTDLTDEQYFDLATLIAFS